MSTSELVIKPMSKAHLNDVMSIEGSVFPAPWTHEMFRQEVEDTTISRPFVGTIEDYVIGYVVSWFLDEEVHLLNVAVAPMHRRKGYGKLLVEYLIELAISERKHLITLEVRRGNEAARQLYQSYRFQLIGVRKNYYESEEEDALVMTLDLVDRGSR